MEVTRDEAATSEAGGGQPRNPISNGNPNPNPNPNPPHTNRGPKKTKSCKGCAYYSSVHKAKSKNPTCFGFSRTLQQVPPYLVVAEKKGSDLPNFKYACIGYSVYSDNTDSSADSQEKTAKLPICVGVEVMMEDTSSTSPVGRVPAHAHKTGENENATPQPQRYKPPNATTEEFLNRFQRNASLVASGVAKNLNRIGHYVKDTLDDILHRRPK